MADRLPKLVTDRWATTQVALALDARPFAASLCKVLDTVPITNDEYWQRQVLLHNRPRREDGEWRDDEWDDGEPYCTQSIGFTCSAPLLSHDELANYKPNLRLGAWLDPAGPRPANLGIARAPPPGCLATWLNALDPYRNDKERRPGRSGRPPSPADVKGVICALVRLVTQCQPKRLADEDAIGPEMVVALLVWLEVLFGDSLPPGPGLNWAEQLGLRRIVEKDVGIATRQSVGALVRQVHKLSRPPRLRAGDGGEHPPW